MTSSHGHVARWKADSWAYAVWGAFIWVLGLSPAAKALARPRSFDANTQEGIVNYSANQEGSLATWLSFGVPLLVLGLGGMVLLLWLASRQVGLPKAGLGLWLGAMAFVLGPLLSSRFGLQPSLSLGLLSLPVVFTIIYLLPPVSLSWFVSQVKKVLLFYAYGSLLAALVAPQWAVQYQYTEGLIPGFDVRLHGLLSHANTLAFWLVTCFILNWFSPSKTRWGSLHQAVVLLALVLTQSKTMWILLVLAYLIRVIYAAWNLPRLQRHLALLLLGAILSGAVVYLITTGPAWLYGLGNQSSDEQLTTLTGRTLIWGATLNLWEQSPWFGYGPDLWNTQMGRVYAPLIGHAPPHAHNQLYQTLGEAGIIGLAGLFVHVVTLLAYGTRYARATSVVALALVLVILLRGITEPPLRGEPSDSNFYIHFIVFAFLMLASKRKMFQMQDRAKVAATWREPVHTRGSNLVGWQ